MGRLRYIGLMLYDADKVLAAASAEDDTRLYEAQRDVFLDPFAPEVIAAAERAGIARDWIDAAQRSPIYALINTYKVALPLHPEYRTMPMVWYIPPLSPVVDVVRDTGFDRRPRRRRQAGEPPELGRQGRARRTVPTGQTVRSGTAIDLPAVGAELLASAAESHDVGRAARTVLHEPGLRATLIALRAGHELAEHDAPPAASLFVVSGNVRLQSSTDAIALTAGRLVAIPHERHSLSADSDAVVLLTVRFD